MTKIFVFVSPREVEFMKQFFHGTVGIKFYVSGGDCNPSIDKESK